MNKRIPPCRPNMPIETSYGGAPRKPGMKDAGRGEGLSAEEFKQASKKHGGVENPGSPPKIRYTTVKNRYGENVDYWTVTGTGESKG